MVVLPVCVLGQAPSFGRPALPTGRRIRVVDVSFVSEVCNPGDAAGQDVMAPAVTCDPFAHRPPDNPTRFCQASASTDRNTRT